jgi:integral membrane sensor domain MASE1
VSIWSGGVAAGAADRGVELRRLLRWTAGSVLFAAAYYLAVKGGYAVKLTGAISAVWPPVGLAAGVLYLEGLRWWPGVVLGNWSRPIARFCSIAYAAIATAANIPGGQLLLIAMIVFNLISTIITTRNPAGDYGKALHALRS